MKILVLAPKPPWPPYDGGAVATMRCIEGLAAAGASISLLSMTTEKHASHGPGKVNPPPSLSYHETVNINTRVRPLKLLSNLLSSSEPYDLLRFRSPEYSAALRNLLAKEHFDIIQCEGLLFSYYIVEIRAMTNAVVVLRAHNIEHRIREMMAGRTLNRLVRLYLKNLAERVKRREVLAAQLFDAIVPISEPDFQWFRSASPDTPAMLSETGVELYETLPEEECNIMKVGFIGALNWQPNLDGIKWFMKYVWPDVLKEVPEAILYIAGRGAHRDAIKWFHGKNVVFKGEVDDARRFTESMTVMIAPLFAGSGLRIKIIEAMSLGRAVVATPIAVAGLPVTDRHELFISKDAASFSEKLNELLSNPVLRKEIATAALDMVSRRYNNLRQTSRLFDFYKTLQHGS